MAAAKKLVDSKILKSLVPLCDLDEVNLARLEGNCVVERLEAGTQLFARGERDNTEFYLLGGQVQLDFPTGLEKIISANSAHARRPIAPGQPRPATAFAKTIVTILRFESSFISELMNWADKGYEVTDLDGEDDNDWMTLFLQSKVFLKLPAQNIQALMMRMEEVTVRKGQAIVRQGDDDGYYYIVKRGRCRVTRKYNSHDEGIELAELTQGSGFGEEALLTQNRRGATVTMLSNGSLMRLTRNDFSRLLVEPLIVESDYDDVATKPDSIFLDVRSCDDHLEDGITGSQNISVAEIRMKLDTLDKNKQYVVCSKTGSRAAAAAFLLCQQGMNAVVLKGGLDSLSLRIKRGNYSTPKGGEIPLVDNVVSFNKPSGPGQDSPVNPEKIMDDPRVQALFGRAKRRVQHEADLTKKAEDARSQAEAEVQRLAKEAEQARRETEEARREVKQARKRSAEVARLEAKKEAVKIRDLELGAKQAEMDLAIRQAEEQARRASTAEDARKEAERETERLKAEMQTALSHAREEAKQSASALKKQSVEEIEKEKEAARLRAEALALEQAEKNIAIRHAEENASRAEASEKARLQAEAEIDRLREEFKKNRREAEMYARRMAEEARDEAQQQTADAVRREAREEIEQVRQTAAQERQLLEIQAIQAAEVARTEAINEVQLNADTEALKAMQADQARVKAEQEIVRLQQEAQAARQQIQDRLVLDSTRAKAEQEVASARAQKLANKQAEIENITLRAESEFTRVREAEEARDRAVAELTRMKAGAEYSHNPTAGINRKSIQQAAAELAGQQSQSDMELASKRVAEESVRARAAELARTEAQAEIQRLREEVAVATLQAQTQQDREVERAAAEVDEMQQRAKFLEKKEDEIDAAIKRAAIDAKRANEAEQAQDRAQEEIERLKAEADRARSKAEKQGKANIEASEKKARKEVELAAKKAKKEALKAKQAEVARKKAEQEIERLKAVAEAQRLKSEQVARESVVTAKKQLEQKLAKQRAAKKARLVAERERQQAEQEIERNFKAQMKIPKHTAGRNRPPSNTVNSAPLADSLSNDIPLDIDERKANYAQDSEGNSEWVSSQAINKMIAAPAPQREAVDRQAPMSGFAPQFQAPTPGFFDDDDRASFDSQEVNPYLNTQRVNKAYARRSTGKLRNAAIGVAVCVVLSAAGYYLSAGNSKKDGSPERVTKQSSEGSSVGGITDRVKSSISELGQSARKKMKSAIQGSDTVKKVRPVAASAADTGTDVAIQKPLANENSGLEQADFEGTGTSAPLTMEQRIQQKRERSESRFRRRLEKNRQQDVSRAPATGEQQADTPMASGNTGFSVTPPEAAAGNQQRTSATAPADSRGEMLPIPAAEARQTSVGDEWSLIDRVLKENNAGNKSRSSKSRTTTQVNDESPQSRSEIDSQQDAEIAGATP